MGVENLESTSPDDSTVITDAADVSTSQDKGSESSAKPEGEKFDLLSVVRDAVKPKDGDSASPASQEAQSDQPKADAQAPAKTEPKARDDENFSDVPFHKHPRFQEVVAERNRYREGARQYEQVQTFLTTNGLSPEDAADALLLWAEMKTNPQEAWKRLKPRVQQLLVDAGEVIPGDLQQKVQAGEISRDAALEMARLRARTGQMEKSSARQAEEAQQRAQQERVNAVVQTVASWERETRAKDPDFALKEEDIQKEVIWLQRRDGVPDTPDKARKQVQDAYDAVNKRVAASRPKQEKRPVTGGRVASGNPTSPPGSMLELVRTATRSAG